MNACGTNSLCYVQIWPSTGWTTDTVTLTLDTKWDVLRAVKSLSETRGCGRRGDGEENGKAGGGWVGGEKRRKRNDVPIFYEGKATRSRGRLMVATIIHRNCFLLLLFSVVCPSLVIWAAPTPPPTPPTPSTPLHPQVADHAPHVSPAWTRLEKEGQGDQQWFSKQALNQWCSGASNTCQSKPITFKQPSPVSTPLVWPSGCQPKTPAGTQATALSSHMAQFQVLQWENASIAASCWGVYVFISSMIIFFSIHCVTVFSSFFFSSLVLFVQYSSLMNACRHARWTKGRDPWVTQFHCQRFWHSS